MAKIDFSELKSRYDIATVIEQETGYPVSYGKKIRCPFHDDSTPSMVCYPDGRYHCFGCGADGDLLDFLAGMWSCDIRTVIDRLNDPDFAAPIRHIPTAMSPSVKLHKPLSSSLVDKGEERMGEREFAYWRKQGIPAYIPIKQRVGFAKNRYLFPWFYRGMLTAIKTRRDDDIAPGLEPKYLSVTGSRFVAPYNIDAILIEDPRTVLILEDEKSVMAAMRYKLVAIAAPANAWKRDWCSFLHGTQRVIIVADNDDAGMISAAKIKAMMPRAEITSAPNNHKDMFDFHCHLFASIGDRDVETRAIYDWLEIQ
jgi:DNA primase